MRPEYRFVFVDFVCILATGERRTYEAGHSYLMPPAVAHAAAKRGFVAKRRPIRWTPPSLLSATQTLATAEVIAAEAELRALQRHALEIVEQED